MICKMCDEGLVAVKIVNPTKPDGTEGISYISYATCPCCKGDYLFCEKCYDKYTK